MIDIHDRHNFNNFENHNNKNKIFIYYYHFSVWKLTKQLWLILQQRGTLYIMHQSWLLFGVLWSKSKFFLLANQVHYWHNSRHSLHSAKWFSGISCWFKSLKFFVTFDHLISFFSSFFFKQFLSQTSFVSFASSIRSQTSSWQNSFCSCADSNVQMIQ